MEQIITELAPTPGGHYAQAIRHDGNIYVSGQLPFTPEGGKISGNIMEQTRQILTNIEAIAQAVGLTKNHIVKTTAFVSDMSLWGDVNQIYSEFFENHKPARSIVPVKDLHYGFLIEIEAIIACD